MVTRARRRRTTARSTRRVVRSVMETADLRRHDVGPDGCLSGRSSISGCPFRGRGGPESADKALVFCVDEKPQVQALDRTEPVVCNRRPRSDLAETGLSTVTKNADRLMNISPARRRGMPNLAPVERRPPVRPTPPMVPVPPTLVFLMLLFSGGVNRNQQAIVGYQLEENRALRRRQNGRWHKGGEGPQPRPRSTLETSSTDLYVIQPRHLSTPGLSEGPGWGLRAQATTRGLRRGRGDPCQAGASSRAPEWETV